MAKILIVDDEEHIRYLHSEELSESGYEVITADSGYKLMERIEDETDVAPFRVEIRRGNCGAAGRLQIWRAAHEPRQHRACHRAV